MTNENGNYIHYVLTKTSIITAMILQVGLHTRYTILILWSQTHKAEYIFVNWSPTDHIERAS